MKGIDFIVSHRECAHEVLRHLECHSGFRRGEEFPNDRLETRHRRPDGNATFIIRACFMSNNIYFNEKFDDGFTKVVIRGNDANDDRREVDRAINNVRRGYSMEVRGMRHEPIMGHRHSRHDDHIVAMDMAMQRKFIHADIPKFNFKNLFTKEDKPKFKDMQITKTEKLKINGKVRNVTIVVLNEGKTVKAGYSVRMPGDKANEELGVTIALGRANKESTNLVDMKLGKGLDKKFILYAIAEDLLKKIERGIIEIKGVK